MRDDDAFPLLSSVLEGSIDPDLFMSLIQEFEHLSDKAELVHRLQAISGNTEALSQIASRSYSHVNGFDKLVLKYHGRKYPSLRVHVWQPHTDQMFPDVHNHPWSFRARIMVGELLNVTFEECMEDEFEEPLLLDKYKVNLGDHQLTGHRVEYVGQRLVRGTARYHHTEGSEYSFGTEFLHQNLIVPDKPCITLFLQMPFSTCFSYCFKIPQPRLSQEVKVDTFARTDLLKRINQCLALLS